MDSNCRQKQFMYLLERIGDPLYQGPRGQGKSIVIYNLPPDYLEEYESNTFSQVRDNIPPGKEVNVSIITVNKPSVPYDLKAAQVVPRNAAFSYLNPQHQKAADSLVKILMSQPSITDYFNTCCLCRDQLNPHLWLHAFIATAQRREDMKGFAIPNLWEVAPDLFFQAKFLKAGAQQGSLRPEDRGIIEVPLDFTGFDTNPEHKVAYWREDGGLNAYHWQYHLANPFTAPKGSIDRQGELFYHIHHEALARYDTERLSQGLNRVLPFFILEGAVIEEAYFPKLTLLNSGRTYPGRQANTKIQDVNRRRDPAFGNIYRVTDHRIMGDRLKEAVDAGFGLSADGKKVSLLAEDGSGISILGGMMEPSENSVNRGYYRDYHNFGHRIIAVAHDPDFRHKEPPSVMGGVDAAMRDPIFYRWHRNVDIIFTRLKEKLPPYKKEELNFEGISVSHLEVATPSLEPNTLLTFWTKSDIDLSRGLDFGRTDVKNLGPIWARVTHLNHKDFEYRMNINNSTGYPVGGTVRIYMAPKKDEQGVELPFRNEQRPLFFLMDKFAVKLKPGDNPMTRKSVESALTIPWNQTFRKLERDAEQLSEVEAFCGCGWPQHLLIPKGRHDGFPMDVVVMVTNRELDKVEDPKRNEGPRKTQKHGCIEVDALCGAFGRKFPDKRPMGFPFDRLPPKELDPLKGSIHDFIKPYGNMGVQEVKIFHRDVTIVRENNNDGGKQRIIKVY